MIRTDITLSVEKAIHSGQSHAQVSVDVLRRNPLPPLDLEQSSYWPSTALGAMNSDDYETTSSCRCLNVKVRRQSPKNAVAPNLFPSVDSEFRSVYVDDSGINVVSRLAFLLQIIS